MDRDLVGFDEASDPGVEHTNWTGHVAHVPPARSGPRPSWTPAPAAHRGTPGAAGSRVAIPIAPPDAWDGAPTDVGVDPGEVPPPSAFRTPAPAPARSEPPSSSSTLLVLGAGFGALTVATLGAVGVVGVVVAVMAFVPRGAAVSAPPAPVDPVVVAAVAPGEPTRAVVSRDVGKGGGAAQGGGAARSAGAASGAGRSAPAPKGLLQSTVDAVASFVSPAPAPTPTVVTRPPPRVEAGPSASAVSAADYGLAPAPAAGGAAARAAGPQEISVADQVVVDRPGSGGLSAPVGRPVDEIAVPLGAPAAAPAPTAWSTVVDTVTSYVTGAPPAAPAPAVPPSNPSQRLAAGDDLDDLVATLGQDRAANAPPPRDDATAALLASLDEPSPGPAARGGAPVGAAAAPAAAGRPGAAPSDDLSALLGDLGSDRPPEAAGSADPVTGAVAPGAAPAGAAAPGAAPGAVAAVGGPAVGADPMASLLADLDVDRPLPAAAGAQAAAPAPAGGWYDTVVAVGSTVASYVTGNPADATFAPAGPAAASGPGLALDDDTVLRGPRANPAAAPLAVDDETAALLASLDDPMPGAGRPTMASGGGSARAAGAPTAPAAAQGPATGGTDLDTAALLAELDADRGPTAAELRPPTMTAAAAPTSPTGSPVPGSTPTGAAAAPAGAAPAASGGWYDTVVGVGSTVASMLGGDATFTPSAPGAAAGPGLALDDDERFRSRAAPPAGSPDAVLAELDGPMPGAGRPTMGAAPARPAAGGGAAPVGAADDPRPVVGSVDAERSESYEPAGGYAQTAAAWAGAVANTLLGESEAPAGPRYDATTAYFAPTAVASGAPAARPCGEGEGCDNDLVSWRDDGSATNLLEEDDLELAPVSRTSEAELFATPGAETDRSNDFDSLTTLLVNVTTDVAGIPVEIDGKKLGNTPLTAELAAGFHTVRLFGGGDAVTTFRMNADQDPDEWCFELKGRTLKNVTCR